MAKIVDCFQVIASKKPSRPGVITSSPESKLCCIGDNREVYDLTTAVQNGVTLDEALVDSENEMAVLALRMFDERQLRKEPN